MPFQSHPTPTTLDGGDMRRGRGIDRLASNVDALPTDYAPARRPGLATPRAYLAPISPGLRWTSGSISPASGRLLQRTFGNRAVQAWLRGPLLQRFADTYNATRRKNADEAELQKRRDQVESITDPETKLAEEQSSRTRSLSSATARNVRMRPFSFAWTMRCRRTAWVNSNQNWQASR